MISFRVGGEDAVKLKPEFAPVFDIKDMINLQNASLKEALRLKFTPKIAEELKRILSSFIEFQLEKPLKTLSFLYKVCK